MQAGVGAVDGRLQSGPIKYRFFSSYSVHSFMRHNVMSRCTVWSKCWLGGQFSPKSLSSPVGDLVVTGKQRYPWRYTKSLFTERTLLREGYREGKVTRTLNDLLDRNSSTQDPTYYSPALLFAAICIVREKASNPHLFTFTYEWPSSAKTTPSRDLLAQK